MNLFDVVSKMQEIGYETDDAQARVCQDIVLKAISKSTLSRNVTIKGGVVMRSITNNIRRATQDMSAILKRVKFVFRDKIYKDRVDKSDKRWLDTEIDEVFDGIVEYLNTFK